ncbi:MAG: hypothetical protein Q7T41_00645 [Candidatus Saccharibacteria bacterium]|nr:hypothetical protein [Candidatus Saccharibacteria bacterium]
MSKQEFRGGIDSTFYQGTIEKVLPIDYDTAPIEVLASAIIGSYTGNPDNCLTIGETVSEAQITVWMESKTGRVAIVGATA